ncbi:photosystem II complex extrinsic protein PsbU [Synechococcus sp. PCC 7336]|uniref:photosystem II complex extrinsic protein PsbU n=1 Tax=Synechococcus sp. PCC 7336 TaxID=195250 RepID=UPI00034CF1B6|nr:photosystem II complex extrinsic protein PsbU [Synechococcus sp. PCC 7336]
MKSLVNTSWSRFVTIALAIILSLSSIFTAPMPALAEAGAAEVSGIPVAELEVPLDVNYDILRTYRELPGFYPTLARKIIFGAPYDKIDDVLDIEGLTDTEKQLLEANLKNLKAGAYDEGANYLENRINKGYYD